MPHCIIEHSRELESRVEPSKLLNAVYQGALDTGLFNAQDIKTRTLAYDNHLKGEQRYDFIHVALRILSGRTTEQKQQLTQSVIEQLKAFELTEISITVEVLDIDRDSHAGHVV